MTDFLDLARFLHRLGHRDPTAHFVAAVIDRCAKRRRDGSELDSGIGAFGSQRGFQSSFTPPLRAVDRPACRLPVRLRRQAAAAGGGCAAAGHGRTADQTHRHRLGRIHRPVRGDRGGSGPRPRRRIRHQCRVQGRRHSSIPATCSTSSIPAPSRRCRRRPTASSRMRAPRRNSPSASSTAALTLVADQAVSEQVVDQRRQALQAAHAAETQAEGALKAAQLNVEFTHVMAPITGRVSRHLVSVGNLVQGSDNGGVDPADLASSRSIRSTSISTWMRRPI